MAITVKCVWRTVLFYGCYISIVSLSRNIFNRNMPRERGDDVKVDSSSSFSLAWWLKSLHTARDRPQHSYENRCTWSRYHKNISFKRTHFFRKRSSLPKPDANWISFHAPSPSSVLLPMIFFLLRWNQFLEWLWLNLWINFVSPTGDKRRRLEGIRWRWSLFSVGYWFV